MNFWALSSSAVLKQVDSSVQGLTHSQITGRLKTNGFNLVEKESARPALKILLLQFQNWLITALLLAALISYFLGERLESLVIISVVFLSVFSGFIQEYRAEKALKKLRKYISHKAKVLRDGLWQQIDSQNLVIGDIVQLRIGDIVPADMRLIKLDSLLTNEAVLTGESIPVVKKVSPVSAKYFLPQDLINLVFMGTAVAGGRATGVVVATGKNTFFGKTAAYLGQNTSETEFQVQTRKFSQFLFRVILVMTVFVFVVNAWQNKGVFNSFLFALALAVGITPEMLPAIMTITLSQGALQMAKKKVIVKRLMSVEDLGNIDTLCTDKTGTLTEGKFSLSDFITLDGQKDLNLVAKALVCTSGFNSTDQALRESEPAQLVASKLKEFKVIDENEFDFDRRRMSVLVKINHQPNLLIVKGAPDSILSISQLSSTKRQQANRQIAGYENSGFRVIAVAEKQLNHNTSSQRDETKMTLIGLLLFTDPVKLHVKESLVLLNKLGIDVKIISGDSPLITYAVAKQVGLTIDKTDIITGDLLAKMSAADLATTVNRFSVFARITPELKYKIVKSLNQKGCVIGFLGDGINDAPALEAADVGIAVDTGTDISKDAADIILLKKDLQILAEGIQAGRKTFANIMKYILNTISANFGNMFTVSVSSLFLNFIPLLPSQILLNNFISDVPLLTVATDNVDREFIKKPKHWNIKMIGRFMTYFGLISSFFDLALILPLLLLWKVPPGIFRTAWFVESSLSEMIVTFAIRTRLPFYKSLPSFWLIGSTLLSCLLVIALPLLIFGHKFFEFHSLSLSIWTWLAAVLFLYFMTTEFLKRWFFNRYENS
ncbi:MAG: magnesium-translocating P-type ATPase [Candidatus Beckwithbacteria bacterium]|nr:magnesium-translocating P-type ATPase [Candidatus Beckwithbacteria bacterium]